MGTENNGEQVKIFNYKQEGTSQGFNRLLHHITPEGILEGGEITQISDVSVNVAPFIATLRDDDKNVTIRFETTKNATVAVEQSRPYVVARFKWLNTETNYVDIIGVQYSAIEASDVILGKVVYVGATFNNVDYSRKQWSHDYYDGISKKVSDFRVTSTEPESDSIHVNPGTAVIGGKKVTFAGNDIALNLNVSLLRKDIVCLNNDGELFIIEGEQDSVFPKAPTFPSDVLTLAIISLPSNPDRITGNMIENIYLNNVVQNASRKVPLSIQGDTTSSLIEDDANFILDGSTAGDFTLSKATYDMSKITVTNIRETNVDINFGSGTIDTLPPQGTQDYIYYNNKWRLFKRTIEDWEVSRWLRFDFADANRKSLIVKKGTVLHLDTPTNTRWFTVDEDTSFDFSANMDTSALADLTDNTLKGRDFYVYIVPDGTIGTTLVASLRSDAPSDIDVSYTTSNTRMIGSFHTECVDVGTINNAIIPLGLTVTGTGIDYNLKLYRQDTDSDFYNFYKKSLSAVTTGTYYNVGTVTHTLSGWLEGQILPESVFCVSFKPTTCRPDGMCFDYDTQSCIDLYLQSGTGQETKSKYNAVHTVSRQQINHDDDMRQVGKSLIGDKEFTSSAYGSNERTTIQGASDKTYVGGHVDTAGRRMTSFIGCEEMCGYLWQWTREYGPTDDGTGPTTYDGQASFGQYWYTIFCVLAGGSWNHSSGCGSRCRDGYDPRSSVVAYFGGRGSSLIYLKSSRQDYYF